jgi:MFS family permease
VKAGRSGHDGFFYSGHFPTLIAALLYFDVSFMVWVLLRPLAPFLREEFGLTATQQGLLVALPLLGGSLFRPVLGMLGDRIGGRRAGLIGLALTVAPLLLGWQAAHTLGHFYVVGLLLGIAGASFAVALPLASGWYPPQYQGLAMGIAGAGNSGSLLATLAAPRLAQRFGWASTFGLMMLPVLVVSIQSSKLRITYPMRGPYLACVIIKLKRSMFRLIVTVKRGVASDLAATWIRYPTLEAARAAAEALARNERVAHVMIVRDDAPPSCVEWAA